VLRKGRAGHHGLITSPASSTWTCRRRTIMPTPARAHGASVAQRREPRLGGRQARDLEPACSSSRWRAATGILLKTSPAATNGPLRGQRGGRDRAERGRPNNSTSSSARDRPRPLRTRFRVDGDRNRLSTSAAADAVSTPSAPSSAVSARRPRGHRHGRSPALALRSTRTRSTSRPSSSD